MIYVSSGIQGSQFLTKKLLICKSFPGICLLLSPSFWPGRCRCWRLRYGTRRRAGRTKPENILWCIFLISLYRKIGKICKVWHIKACSVSNAHLKTPQHVRWPVPHARGDAGGVRQCPTCTISNVKNINIWKNAKNKSEKMQKNVHLSWPPRRPAGSPADQEGGAPPWLPETTIIFRCYHIHSDLDQDSFMYCCTHYFHLFWNICNWREAKDLIWNGTLSEIFSLGVLLI